MLLKTEMDDLIRSIATSLERIADSLDKPSGKKASPTRAFKPPSLQEVTEYCQERSNKVDPETFIDHYQANGWMRGKNKVKDWKSCVRTWEKSRLVMELMGNTGSKRNIGDLTNERLNAETQRSGDQGPGNNRLDVSKLVGGKET